MIDLAQAAAVVEWCREEARSESLQSDRSANAYAAWVRSGARQLIADELTRLLTEAGLGAMVDSIKPEEWATREKAIAALSRIADRIERAVPQPSRIQPP